MSLHAYQQRVNTEEPEESGKASEEQTDPTEPEEPQESQDPKEPQKDYSQFSEDFWRDHPEEKQDVEKTNIFHSILVRHPHDDTLQAYDTVVFGKWFLEFGLHPETHTNISFLEMYVRSRLHFLDCYGDTPRDQVDTQFTNQAWRSFLEYSSEYGPILSSEVSSARAFCDLTDAEADGLVWDISYEESKAILKAFKYPVGSWFFRKSSLKSLMPHASLIVVVYKKLDKVEQFRLLHVHGVGWYTNFATENFKSFQTMSQIPETSKTTPPDYATLVDVLIHAMNQKLIHPFLAVRRQ